MELLMKCGNCGQQNRIVAASELDLSSKHLILCSKYRAPLADRLDGRSRSLESEDEPRDF